MLKEPRPGRVKTRLGRDIGMTAAAWWFRHQTASLLRRIDDPRWHTVLAVSPEIQGLTSRIWRKSLPRVPQGGGDLGQRMARVMARFPTRRVCVIGADIPGITPTRIAHAATLLGRHDAVFGPAEDGGYWLVGLRRGGLATPRMFAGVRWSTPHALADTMAALDGWRIGLADRLADIDTGADLHRLNRR